MTLTPRPCPPPRNSPLVGDADNDKLPVVPLHKLPPKTVPDPVNIDPPVGRPIGPGADIPLADDGRFELLSMGTGETWGLGFAPCRDDVGSENKL